MSASATTWAWQVDGITDRQRLALLALADQADDDGAVRATPPSLHLSETIARTLAARLHLDPDQAADVLADLDRAGLTSTVRSGATRRLQLALTRQTSVQEVVL